MPIMGMQHEFGKIHEKEDYCELQIFLQGPKIAKTPSKKMIASLTASPDRGRANMTNE